MTVKGSIRTGPIVVSLFAFVTPQVWALGNGSIKFTCSLATGSYPVFSYPHLAGLADCFKQSPSTPVSGVKVNWGFGYAANFTKVSFPIKSPGDYPGLGFVDSLQPTTNSSGLASIFARNEGALSGPSQVLICVEPTGTHTINCVFFQ